MKKAVVPLFFCLMLALTCVAGMVSAHIRTPNNYQYVDSEEKDMSINEVKAAFKEYPKDGKIYICKTTFLCTIHTDTWNLKKTRIVTDRVYIRK